jgi:hypothetical protein
MSRLAGETCGKAALRHRSARDLGDGDCRPPSYLNAPPITEAKKITAATKSNAATIFPLKTMARRAIGQRGWRRGSNLEDRNFYYGRR